MLVPYPQGSESLEKAASMNSSCGLRFPSWYQQTLLSVLAIVPSSDRKRTSIPFSQYWHAYHHQQSALPPIAALAAVPTHPFPSAAVSQD
eukprot:467886-Rhodomonas_salina.2